LETGDMDCIRKPVIWAVFGDWRYGQYSEAGDMDGIRRPSHNWRFSYIPVSVV
jgi:hypothetical protein